MPFIVIKFFSINTTKPLKLFFVLFVLSVDNIF